MLVDLGRGQVYKGLNTVILNISNGIGLTEMLKFFYERLYLHQSYCWYAFIRQDFIMYYRHTQKWVDLFHENKHMLHVEPAHYIKGMHNLLNAHFDLRNYQQFEVVLKEFENFSKTNTVTDIENNRIQTFVYLTTAKINGFNMMYGPSAL